MISSSASQNDYRLVSIKLQCDLGDVEVKSVLEVFRLSDDHQIEAPAAAEVGDDDSVDRHRRQKLLPRSLRSLATTTESNAKQSFHGLRAS